MGCEPYRERKKQMIKSVGALALLGAMTMFGADITGKWHAELEGRDGNKRTMTFNLKGEGDKLTGTN